MRRTNALFKVRAASVRTALSIALLMNSSCGKPDAPPDQAAENAEGGPAAKPDAQPDAPPLWKPIPWSGSYIPTPQAIRSQAVVIDIKLLLSPNNGRISLTLPDESRITAVKARFSEKGENRFIWRGTIDGDPGGVVTFSVVNEMLVGDIVTSRGKMYRVRFVERGVSIVEQLDPAKFPRESEPLRHDSDRGQGAPSARMLRSTSLTDAETLIDVLVLYTKKAAEYDKSIIATIYLAEANTNASYVNSGLSQQIRVVHVDSTEYEERSTSLQDWQLLKGTDDPELNDAHLLRNTHGADIVVLITGPVPASEMGSCGQASQMESLATAECAYAFAVVPVTCATIKHSFPHELGHLMGADHAQPAGTPNTNPPPFDQNRGYETPTKDWHTIMAGPTVTCQGTACPPPPPRILYWSNPEIYYAHTGLPSLATGVVGEANNAATLKQTANTVANFYPSPECGGQTPPTTNNVPSPPNNAPPPPSDVSVR